MIFSFPSAISNQLQRMTLASKLWSSMTLALLAGLILVAIAFNADQRSFTEQQLSSIGRIISQQTAASSASLLLAGDQLSLTINLQQLVDLPQIDGIEILTPTGKTLIQVGHSSELTLQQPITAETTTLGMLQIHLNPLIADYRLAQSLPLTLTASLLTLLLIFAVIWLFNRQLKLTTTSQLNATTIKPHQPSHIAEARPATAPIATTAHSDSHSTQTTAEPHSNTDTPDTKPITANDTTRSVDDPTNHTANADKELTHRAPPPNTAPSDSQTHTAPPSAGSLTSPSHNLQTTHPPQGYLIYANHHVGGSDTLTSNERQQLLVRYRKSLEQVARLYKGEMSEDPLGNWCVRFSPLSNDHSHGINALCAAQLFNALYRGINTQAIRSFSPALNIKLVLLCGKLDSFDALAEDALLLSDRVQANDLITHQALYQIQPLQERLLDNAQYRKHDDDTYLVSALNNDYQTLIDRQAEHFLKQIN